MIDLISLFDAIPEVSDTDVNYSAIPIVGYERHRLAKDSQKFPFVLLACNNNSFQTHFAPIVLENLRILSNVECQVSLSNGSVEKGFFTIIQCTASDLQLQYYFLRVCSSLLYTLGQTPSLSEISIAVNRLIELFQSMKTSSKKALQGLWTELFVIHNSNNPDILVEAWHLAPEDKYDFALGNQRLEVKSSATIDRIHHFSLEQLHPLSDVTILIASLFAKRSQEGLSINELANSIKSTLVPKSELMFKVEQLIIATLGDSWRYASAVKFDTVLAKKSLSFFEVDKIPSVDPNLPFGVSEVRFKADLNSVPKASKRKYRKLGGIFESLF